MIAYKLFRKLKSGEITSLFIDKKTRLVIGKNLMADCYPTSGFTVRKGFHCTAQPKAPHLTEKGRVWMRVKIHDYTTLKRPVSQGGMWYLANEMTILGELI